MIYYNRYLLTMNDIVVLPEIIVVIIENYQASILQSKDMQKQISCYKKWNYHQKAPNLHILNPKTW